MTWKRVICAQMKVKIKTSPFGTAARTSVLLALSLMDESYPRERARLLDLPRPASSAPCVASSSAADGKTALKLTAASTLGTVTLAVGSALRAAGIRAILTGGACVNLHTRAEPTTQRTSISSSRQR